MIVFVGGKLSKTWLFGPRQLYRVVEPVYVYINGFLFCVIEVGFITDKTSWPSSIEKWLPNSWTQDSRVDWPSVFHDYMLLRMKIPKWTSDLLYKAALRSMSVSALKTWIFGSAVRIKKLRHKNFYA